MTRYFLGIEDLSKPNRVEGQIDYRTSLSYIESVDTEEHVKFIEPEGMTWLNGEPFRIGLRNKSIEELPVVSNRPTDKDTESITIEAINYDHKQSNPTAPERIAVYHPINNDGVLEVLLHGELREIRATVIAEYFAHSGVLDENIAEIIQLNNHKDEEIAIAA